MRRKIKLFQAAKRLKLSSEALVRLLKELGFGERGYTSYITEEEFRTVRTKLEKEKEEIKKSLKRIVREEEKEAESKKNKERIERTVQKVFIQAEKRRIKKKYRKREEKEEEKEEKKVKEIKITPYMSIAELAHLLDTSPAELIKRCIDMGTFATLNQRLDIDTIEILVNSFGYEAKREEEISIEEPEEELEKGIILRPPTIVVLGHVDHGKTTLLDCIRKRNVAAQEYGGITQRIGAYTAKIDGFKMVFLDTPGHEAFTAMRARGAQVADIAVLVVAANEGVKPQTIEAISHARAAQLPMIVAITKIDLPDKNIPLVQSQLAKQNVVLEDYGGDTIGVEVSSKTGEGIQMFLEAIQLKAMESNLKTSVIGRAKGVVIEGKLDKRRGNIATVIIQKGTLRKGDPFICGELVGRVRELLDENGKKIDEASPGVPVQILGFPDVPEPGEIFKVVASERIAKEIAQRRQLLKRERKLKEKLTLQSLQEEIKKGKIKELKIILKGDVYGSVEALRKSLEELSTEEVQTSILHAGVGAINVSDVNLAKASGAIVLGFHVEPLFDAKEKAEREGVEIRTYKLIYDVIDDVRAAMVGLLEPEEEEVLLGKAEIRKVFNIPKVGKVAGCYISEGKVEKNSLVRLYREGKEIGQTSIESLKRFEKSVSEVESGYECGIKLKDIEDIKENDTLNFYQIVKK